MKSSANSLLSKLERDIKSQNMDSDYSIYTGSVGIFFMYWHMNQLSKRPIPQDVISINIKELK